MFVQNIEVINRNMSCLHQQSYCLSVTLLVIWDVFLCGQTLVLFMSLNAFPLSVSLKLPSPSLFLFFAPFWWVLYIYLFEKSDTIRNIRIMMSVHGLVNVPNPLLDVWGWFTYDELRFFCSPLLTDGSNRYFFGSVFNFVYMYLPPMLFS